MRFGLDVAQQRMTWGELVDRVQLAESLGFDGAWGFDHFQPMYGDGPGECFEGYTTLAALTGHTERIRLGLLVSGVTYRPPALLAAEAITIDHASSGRLELAVGAAWFEPEHRALGFDFPPTGARMDLLEETLEVLDGLLTTDGFSFEGEHVQIDDATMHPRPVQAPRPPIWIGGGGERRTLPLVARWADAWHCFGGPDTLAAKGRIVDDLASEAGRDPATILRSASLDLSQPLDDIRRDAAALADVGIGYAICGWPGEGAERVEAFATDIAPELSDR
jgi:F420-dependent oxidoreductase-like protein